MPEQETCASVCPMADLLEFRELRRILERIESDLGIAVIELDDADKRNAALRSLKVEVAKQTKQLDALGAIGFGRSETELILRNRELEADNAVLRQAEATLINGLKDWQATYLKRVGDTYLKDMIAEVLRETEAVLAAKPGGGEEAV